MPGANIPILDWLRQMKSTLEELVEGVAITDYQLRVAFANEALIRSEHCDRAGMPSRIPNSLFPAEGRSFITKRNESKFTAMAAVTWFQSPIYVLQYTRNRRAHGFMWLWQRKPRFAPGRASHFSSKE
jgi:hypothetical protein